MSMNPTLWNQVILLILEVGQTLSGSIHQKLHLNLTQSKMQTATKLKEMSTIHLTCGSIQLSKQAQLAQH